MTERHSSRAARAILAWRRSTALLSASVAATLALGLAVPAGVVSAQAQDGTLLQASQGDQVQQVDLGLNKSLVIDLPEDAFDILVADPSIADAVTRSARRIYLFGRKVGETNIFVFGEDGRTIANIDVSVERDVASLEGDLERFIPGSDIEVEIVNDNVVLSGIVMTPQDANRAERLANAFLVGGNAAELNEDGGQSSIVNLLTIAGEDQVTLKLTVAEVQRTVIKQLGITLTGSMQTAVLGDGIGGGSITGSAGAVGDTANGIFSIGGNASIGDFSTSLNATLQALNRVGAIRTLAEPSLTAVSGESAEFRVGGAIAFAVRNTVNGVTETEIETIDYGVELEFKPVVLSSGRISINLGTAVSEPVPSGVAGDSTLFALRQRVARTTVEVPSGGSFMIAGLISDSVRQNVRETPGLAKLPILGALFRSRDYQREETEMVIIATPYLVRPTPRSAQQAPTDNFHPANDSKGFFLGRINRIYGNRKEPDAPFHGNVGFVYK